jgi:hypothetical protein
LALFLKVAGTAPAKAARISRGRWQAAYGGVSIMESPLLLQSPWLIELVRPVFPHVGKEQQIGTERLDVQLLLDFGFCFEGVEP